MRDVSGWVVALVAAAAIIALILFARGGAERGNPDASPAAAAAVAVA
jgi:hypothetical protein